jgi:hypothetical protein
MLGRNKVLTGTPAINVGLSWEASPLLPFFILPDWKKSMQSLANEHQNINHFLYI